MKKRLIGLILVLTLALYWFPLSVFAETIILKSGDTIEGKIIEKSDKYKYIKIDHHGRRVSYYFEDIESIDGEKPVVSLTPSKKLKSSQEESILIQESPGSSLEKKSSSVLGGKIDKLVLERIRANEEAVQATLLPLFVSALKMYKLDQGLYPERLEELALTKPAYVPSYVASGRTQGYIFDYIVGTNRATYKIIAKPEVSQKTGIRIFAVDQNGKIEEAGLEEQ